MGHAERSRWRMGAHRMHRAISVFTVLMGMLSSDAYAQREVYADYDTQLAKNFEFNPTGQNDFGDRTDYATGATSFFVSTANLPGNSNLDVSFRHILRAYDDGMGTRFVWEQDLPYLSGIFSIETGWIAGTLGPNAGLRCSHPNGPAKPPEVPSTSGKPGTFFPEEYWKGNYLVLPGGSTLAMNALYTPAPVQPSLGGPYKWATNSNWFFSCLTLPSGGEAFLAINPNGEKYYFDQFATGSPVPQLRKYNSLGDTRLSRREFRIYVSKVEDRFGNSVNYSYSGGLLSRIESSDGRVITPTYAGSTLASVTDGARTWGYDFSSGLKITYPDLSTWEFTKTTALTRSETSSQSCGGTFTSRYNGSVFVNIKTRAGALGAFTFAARQRGLSYVEYSCQEQESGSSTFLQSPSILEEIALVSKTISGPGLPDHSTTIDYGPTNGCFTAMSTVPLALRCTATSPTTRTVTISESGPKFTRLTFGNKARVNADVLQKAEYGSSASSILRSEVSEWQTFDPIGDSVSGVNYDVAYWSVYRRELKKRMINQQGRSHTRNIVEFDQLARPKQVELSSAPLP